MTIANNVIAKIAAVVAGLGLVAMSFAYAAPAAKADTTTDLQAQIAALMAQIEALKASAGTSATVSATFTKDLTVGSKGADVTALQNWLIAKGFSIPAGATGTFGAQTKAAVASWQASAGITPAAGYFGAKSRAVANASATTGTTGGTSTTGLTGTGRFTGVSSLGDVNSDLKEGDAETSVVGASFDATDGDVAIQRVDATFDVANVGSQSANLNKYVSKVSVYLDGKKLASMDATAGDKDGRTWTLRFAGLNGVVKKGQTGNLYVKVTPAATIDANEDGKTVTAKLLVDSVRAVGADGISETYVSTTIQQAFTVSSKTTGTLTVSVAGDNPKASQVAVSSSTTTGVKLLSFTAKAKNQALKITDLVASFGTSDNNLNDVVSTVKLMKGDTVLKSKTLSTGTYGTITFDNMSETIAKDVTATYTIVADLKGDASYADGTTLIASTTTSGWDVEDADGNSITPSAQALGNTMTLTATGITVTKGSTSSTVAAGLANSGDIATFKIPFTVTAGDSDVFIAGAGQKTASNTSGKVAFGTTTTSTSGATGEPQAVSITAADTVTGDLAGSYYKVLAGTSRTFTFNATLIATTTGSVTAGNVGVVLNSIAYGATSGAMTSYYVSNLDTFKTDDVFVTKR